ncbi:MAG: fumarylacetoacetate hydrolase family protein [Adhaeribacter sp.]
MKLYQLTSGVLVEEAGQYFRPGRMDWDELVNRDRLHAFLQKQLSAFTPVATPLGAEMIAEELLPPISRQEVWAAGVTYYRSREARMEESRDAGGGDFYDRVYAAERPELFFKATAARTVASGGQVRIRRDSTWDVPEPELTLFLNARGSIQGYTIGNDMSSRSIEGENPLYLPQAKTYDGCAALGPCLYVPAQPLPADTVIELLIRRNGQVLVQDRVAISQMKRGQEELAAFLFRECSFPQGCYLMTGTGIVPAHEFTLASGDEIRISIPPIGTLVNTVA